MLGPVAWVASTIEPWIESPQRDPVQFSRWLSGEDPLPIGQAEEPYVWLLRALPRGNRRPEAESALARSSAELLEHADELRNRPQANRLLYNLLGLASGLRGRDYLATPLLKLLDTHALHGLFYEANSLNSMLLAALIPNQRNNTLQPVWESMLQGAPHATLGGNPADGFEGILNMPPSEASRGNPASESIAFALTHLISFFENRPVRVALLRSAIQRVQSRFPGYAWDLELIEFSDRNRWPRWTDVALPALIPIEADART